MNKNKCSSCGEASCSCKNKDFTKAVIEIDNPEKITLMRRVVIPTSMGDDTAVPPAIGKYHNVLLYYEANQKSYLYSSDGIPTLLVNGVTDYEQAVNLPQINGVTLLGDKSSADLGLQPTLSVSPDTGIKLDNNELSGLPATDTTIGMVKPGDGLEVDTDGELSIKVDETQSDWNEADNTKLDYIKNKPTIPVESYSNSEVDTGTTWIDDLTIYKKTIDIGALPDTDTKTVAHGITDFNMLINVTGSFSDGTNSAPLPYSSPTTTKNIQIYVDDTNISIVTGEDRSSYSGYVTLYYTKIS